MNIRSIAGPMTAFWLVMGQPFPSMAEEAPSPGFDISLTSAGDSRFPEVSWHGYFEFEYLDAEEKAPTFDMHKITVWMGVKLSQAAFVSSEVEYEHSPSISGSGAGAGKIKLDSAQLRLTPWESSAAWFGLFYVPFGIEYHSYPGHKNRFVTRPKVMKGGGVIQGTWSDVGAGASISAGPGALDVYIVNGDARNGGIARDTDEGGNDAKTLGARFSLNNLAPGLDLGASYAGGKWDTEGKLASSRLGAHLKVDLGASAGLPLAPLFIAEYVEGKDERAATDGNDLEVGGYYAIAGISPFPWLQLSLRHGAWNSGKVSNGKDNTETSFGAAWTVSANLMAKAEYQTASLAGGDQAETKDLIAIQLVANW